MIVDLSVGEDPEQLHVFVNPEIVEEEGEVTDSRAACRSPASTRRWSARSASV